MIDMIDEYIMRTMKSYCGVIDIDDKGKDPNYVYLLPLNT